MVRDAKQFRHGRGDVAEACARAEIDGFYFFAERNHGDILARMVGMLEIAGIAAMVGGDHHTIILAKLCKQLRQPAVEFMQRLRIAVGFLRWP